MTVKIVRACFILACSVMGVTWARFIMENVEELQGYQFESPLKWLLLGGFVGAALAGIVLFLLHFITQELYERLAPSVAAIVVAVVAGYLSSVYLLFWFPDLDGTTQIFVSVSVVLLTGYMGIHLALTRASNWDALISAVRHPGRLGGTGFLKVVDTSVLIDGRIADICSCGFMEGTLLIPRFVLKELQNIADSADIVRRAKGRRGLDILRELQDEKTPITVSIIEDDPESVREVDGKLVVLAKQYNAKILTTDFNLNKVAQIDGVVVLNINDLANGLKPAVLPDELMEVKLMKEGKEPSQAVGYLDDGTMVVVDNGRSHLGKNAVVLVTSVLQTSAGRMIFTRFNNLAT
ncbi:MAG: TRAM domain-containing protein [Candidatus Hydrogenedentes bacterium]|nr:TRAM domain-containing protein [Candidatus Hydrogenedentota bacterium]